MKSKQAKTFTLKKLVLALALTGYAMGSAYAVLTPSTGSIQGRAPVLSSPANSTAQAVDITTSATGSSLATGDTVTLTYTYNDADGDADASASTTVEWYYVSGSTETAITSVSNTVATSAAGGTGTSVMTIPGAALGATAIKVVITERSATGDPVEGQTITIADVSNNTSGGDTDVPSGPVTPGTNLTPGIYLSTDTAFSNNLIGSATNLTVGNTYVFKLWDGTTDMTSSVTYNWRLTGSSATTGTSAPAEGFNTGVTDGNFTVPVNSTASTYTGSADGAQGFSLAVDYQ